MLNSKTWLLGSVVTLVQALFFPEWVSTAGLDVVGKTIHLIATFYVIAGNAYIASLFSRIAGIERWGTKALLLLNVLAAIVSAAQARIYLLDVLPQVREAPVLLLVILIACMFFVCPLSYLLTLLVPAVLADRIRQFRN